MFISSTQASIASIEQKEIMGITQFEYNFFRIYAKLSIKSRNVDLVRSKTWNEKRNWVDYLMIVNSRHARV